MNCIKRIEKHKGDYIRKHNGFCSIQKGHFYELGLENQKTYYCMVLYGMVVEEGLLCSLLQFVHLLSTGKSGISVVKIKDGDTIYYLLSH